MTNGAAAVRLPRPHGDRMNLKSLLGKLPLKRRANSVTETSILLAFISLVAVGAVTVQGRVVACKLEQAANAMGYDGTEACALLADALEPEDPSDPFVPGEAPPGDNMPRPFRFTDVYNEGMAETQILVSNAPQIRDIGSETTVTVSEEKGISLSAATPGTSSAQVSIAGGPWVTQGVVSPGERIRLRVRAPARGAATKVYVTVGGYSTTWTVATRDKDSAPDFQLSNRWAVEPNSVQSSGWIRLFNFDDPVELSVAGPDARLWINGAEVPELTRTVHPGDFAFFQVRAPAPASGCGQGSALTFYGDGKPFKVWNVDLTYCPWSGNGGGDGGGGGGSGGGGGNNPSAPSSLVLDFGSLTNLDPGTPVESAAATIPAEVTEPTQMFLSPLNSASASVNGGPWTEAPVVSAGDVVRLKALAPKQGNRNDTIFISIGSLLGQWTIATKPVMPDPVIFAEVTNAPVQSRIVSSTVVLSPFSGTVSATVAAASSAAPGTPAPDLLVNGALAPGAQATLKAGDTVQLQQTTPGTFLADSSGVLLLSGMPEAKWTVVTRAELKSPATIDIPASQEVERSTLVTSGTTIGQFDGEATLSVSGLGSPAVSINGGPFGQGGSVRAGDAIQLKALSAAEFSKETIVSVKVGTTVGQWAIVTRAPDTTPEPFALAARNGLESEEEVVSEAVTVSGVEVPVQVSAEVADASPQVSVNGGPWAASVQAASGDTVRVRANASLRMGTDIRVRVSIGTLSTDWLLGTRPSAFPFGDVANIEPATVVTSGAVTISYLNGPASVTVGGDDTAVLVLNGAEAGRTASIQNGDRLSLRVRSASEFSGRKLLTLVASGAISDRGDWQVTTRERRASPMFVGLSNRSDLEPNSLTVSDIITVDQLDGPLTLSVQNGQVTRLGSTSWANTVQISQGDQLRLRATTSDQFLTSTETVLLVAENPGFSRNWSLRTRERDIIADGFTMAQTLDAPVSSVVESPEAVVTGFDGLLDVGVTVDPTDARNVEFRVNGGDWRTSGSISAGQRLQVRALTTINKDEIYNFSIRLGDHVVGSWQMITGPDIYPDAVAFPFTDNAVRGSLVTSQSVTVSGLSVPVTADATLDDEAALFKNGVQVSGSTTVFNGDTLRVRIRSAAGFQETVTATVRIGPAYAVGWAVRTHPSNESPPVWVSTSDLGKINQYKAYSRQLDVTAVNQPVSYSLVTGGLPGAVTLSPAGLISGSPTALGSSFFIVRVTDAKGLFADQPFQVEVVNQPPVWAPRLDLGSVNANKAMADIVIDAATDPEAQPLTYATVAGSSLPAGITFDGATRTLRGTPTTQGSFTFKLGVSDGFNPAVEKTFALGVSPSPSDQSCGSFATFSTSVFGGESGCIFPYAGTTRSWVVPAGVKEIEVKMWGGGGAGSGAGNAGEDGSPRHKGGAGGFVSATVPVTAGETLVFVTAGGGRTSGGEGAGGGGYSGLFRGSWSAGNAILVAGGGGGGGRPNGEQVLGGGAGGGLKGQDSASPSGGKGGTIGPPTVGSLFAGHGTGCNNVPGGWPAGGNGSDCGWGGSGGGGGHYGGTAGVSGTGGTGGPGGGGSSYFDTLRTLNAQTLAGNGTVPGNSLDPDRGGLAIGGNRGVNGGSGRIIITW